MPDSYKEALKKWKNLKRMKDYPIHFFLHISTSLLYTCTMANLKYLEVVLDDYTSMRVGRELHGRDMLAAIIKYIHNAPSLEHLVVSKTAIKLMDLKGLHISLLKLKKLDLKIVHLYSNDNVEEKGDHQVIFANCLESFSIVAFPQDRSGGNRSLGYTQTLINWISFMRTHYTNLEQLDFDYGEFTKEEDNFAEAPARALSNMKKLTSYGVVATRLSRSILNAMETSNIQLDRLKLDMVKQNLMEEQLQLISSSPTTLAIKTLDIVCKVQQTDMSTTSFSHHFFPLSNLLTRLTHVEISHNDYSSQVESIVFLADILQHFPRLESLDFSALSIRDTDEVAQRVYNCINHKIDKI